MATDDEEMKFETREAPPSHFLFKIESFSLLSEHDIKKYESREFDAGGYKWKNQLYPKSGQKQEDDSASVYLYFTECKYSAPYKKVRANFKIGIKNQLNDQRHEKMSIFHWFSSAEDNWGWLEFVPTADLRDSKKGLVVNDCCILEIKIYVEAVASGFL